MPKEKDGYKMRMIIPKPTDPEELKKREELSKRLKEYPNEELKRALEGIQAKKEQGERGSIIIEILEKLGKFSDGKFIFNEGVEKDDGNGKYIEIDGKKYCEWSEGMNGFGYRCVLRENGYYCLFCGEFKDGHIVRGIQIFDSGDKYVGQFKNDERDGQGIYTWPDGDKYVGQWKNDASEGQGTYTYVNGDKYVGQFKNDAMEGQGTFTWANGSKYVGQWKNDAMEGQGTYTCVNGNILTGIWKNDFISEGKMKLKSDGTEIDVIWDRDKGSWKVTTEGEYKNKYIDHTTGEFIEP